MAITPYHRRHSSVPALTGGIEDFDRLFDKFFSNALGQFTGGGSSLADTALRMDISETEDGYLLKADLPGVDEKDIDITIEDGVLTVSGERSEEKEEEGRTFHRIERSWGSFKRSLSLPADADENAIDAQIKNGILEIEIGKTEESQSQAKRIEVRSQSTSSGNGTEETAQDV